MSDINVQGYMDAKDIALHFGGASRSWINVQVKRNVIPAPAKIGGRNLWLRSSIAAYDADFLASQSVIESSEAQS